MREFNKKLIGKLFFTFCLLLVLLSIQSGFSEEKEDNTYRAGIKIGIPNYAGLFGEYVIPVLNKNFTVGADFSYFPFTLEDYIQGEPVDFLITYYNLNAKYYFFGDAEGLYCSAGYGHINFNMKLHKYYVYNLQRSVEGEAKTDSEIMELKLGYRFVFGFFTVATEFGYSSAKIDEIIYVTFQKFNKQGKDMLWTPDFILSSNFFLAGNISFGVAF